jgi:hypothetical protein
MDAGFINTPEPIILPMIIEVADQKPIFWARDEVLVDIIIEEDKERNEARGSEVGDMNR